ncbi:MAG TPA: RNA polymerase sigma factor [Verrucomicrobiae bacterium]|nr:RNA polymerase sigma factor [Verrucomicrobiae bacterium]
MEGARVEVLERFAAGDAEAFECLFRQHQGAVFRWIVRIVRNPAVAEELTVETFWRIHRARSRFDAKKGNFCGWMRRIATNVALDHLRRVQPEVELPEELPARRTPVAAEQNELRRLIYAAMDHLSPQVRAAVLLALVGEEPYEEVGKALGISTAAAKLRVFRGVRVLRKELSRVGVQA